MEVSILSRWITRLVGWAVGVFLQVKRRGPKLPDGPVLVIANHPNAMIDPLVVFRTAGRPTRPLAKAPLFDMALVGTVLRGLGGLPVYRRQDDPTRLHENERTFDAAIGALQAGEAVQLYPEGQSHSEPSLTPLKTGAARIAFLAEERAGWALGLKIVPVGLTYERKHLFRGRVVATVGESIAPGDHRIDYEAAPREAVRTLTEHMTRSLEAVTLNLEASEDRELIEIVEGLYALEKGYAVPRERPSLSRRLPRLQAFARGLAWLRANDPAEVTRLERAVRRYRQIQILLGSREAQVPGRYRTSAVVLHTLRELLTMLLLAPLAAVGTIAWAIPYRAPRWAVARTNPKHDAISTYKLGVAMLAFPLMLALWALLAWRVGGAAWMAGTVLGLPVAGLGWIGWSEHWHSFREDVSVFIRAAPRRRSRERLRELRTGLVEDIDRIAALLPE